MRRNLAFDLLDVRRVEAVVRPAREREPDPADRGSTVALPARFAFARQSFDQSPEGDHP